MAASTSDKLRKVYQNFSTTLASTKALGASTMSLSSATGVPTTTAIDFTVGRVDSSGTRTPSTKVVYKGTLSGTTVSNLTVVEGSDQAHAAGTVVEITWTASTWNDAVDHLLTQHNQDGTHGAVTATSVASTGAVSGTTGTFSTSVSDAGSTLQTYRADVLFDHVASGCVWTADAPGSTRAASMTSGTVYIGGKRVSVNTVSARTFTASKDTYVDVDNTGTITYTEVTNNAASPALASNSVRIAIIVTGASNIANSGSVNQGQESMVLPIASSVPYAVTDSLGNLICPRDPQRRILGYRQILSTFTNGAGAGPFAITGLSVPIIVPTGRKIKVSLYTSGFGNNSAARGGTMTIWDGAVGGTQLTTGVGNSVFTATASWATTVEAITTPSTTSKTYNSSVTPNSAGDQLAVAAGATSPAYIKVELV